MTAPADSKTVRELTRISAEWLAKKGLSDARLDLELLLAEVLGCRRIDLYMDLDRPLTPDELDRFRELLRRRGRREPVSYILGRREFHGLTFKVTKAVLIPRPETEHLVDAAVEELTRDETGVMRRFADIGTGSGCIPIAILKGVEEADARAAKTRERAIAKAEARVKAADEAREALAAARDAGELTAEEAAEGEAAVAPEVVEIPSPLPERQVSGVAVDISPEALGIAAENRATHGLDDRLELCEGDLCGPLMGRGPFDVITSNPPYVTARERADMEPELTEHEPHIALFDRAEDGLDITRRLLAEAREHLKPGGLLLIELGAGRGPKALKLAADQGYVEARLIRDYGGHERVLVARTPR